MSHRSRCRRVPGAHRHVSRVHSRSLRYVERSVRKWYSQKQDMAACAPVQSLRSTRWNLLSRTGAIVRGAQIDGLISTHGIGVGHSTCVESIPRLFQLCVLIPPLSMPPPALYNPSTTAGRARSSLHHAPAGAALMFPCALQPPLSQACRTRMVCLSKTCGSAVRGCARRTRAVPALSQYPKVHPRPASPPHADSTSNARRSACVGRYDYDHRVRRSPLRYACDPDHAVLTCFAC
ncbi:hypothetical protein HYPSUDRAFT_275197 [Hypholoma sublateritium FD-334 SS-4]|uniref:Uncharacterized protein n=1 Tax=Hypholoma sublateritium (strain FD-334 SS-4) TaxID=945553 RepID=A0A0D2LFM8_HYPSF|nr:hypothetical protein HYPSUDRAFT_275197 [Hypholoma sublateritium FD-334 SS-4]